MRALNLSSVQEWRYWCTSGQRPEDIPSDPEKNYRDRGWVSWPDWLAHLARNASRSFEDASQSARTLNLSSQQEWRDWRKTERTPEDVPSDPERAYKGCGWVNWPDWRGYNTRIGIPLQPCENARQYARALIFSSPQDWEDWNKGGQRPDAIHGNTQRAYKGNNGRVGETGGA